MPPHNANDFAVDYEQKLKYEKSLMDYRMEQRDARCSNLQDVWMRRFYVLVPALALVFGLFSDVAFFSRLAVALYAASTLYPFVSLSEGYLVANVVCSVAFALSAVFQAVCAFEDISSFGVAAWVFAVVALFVAKMTDLGYGGRVYALLSKR